MAEVDDAELLLLFAETLRVAPGSLSLDSARGEVAEWDSLAHVMAMLAVEQRYGVQLTLEELEELRTIRQVRDALTRPR